MHPKQVLHQLSPALFIVPTLWVGKLRLRESDLPSPGDTLTVKLSSGLALGPAVAAVPITLDRTVLHRSAVLSLRPLSDLEQTFLHGEVYVRACHGSTQEAQAA